MTINWTKVNIKKEEWENGSTYLYDVPYVLVTDDNEQYCNNDGSWTAKNTEIYVDKGKKTLVIALGDSWTHGEGAEEINHRKHRWEVKDRVEIPYGSKVARILNADYWVFSRPGQSNSGIFTGLYRILNNIPVGRYDDIKVIIQMTDCNRDRLDLLSSDHKLHDLWNKKQDIHISEWFNQYDEIFLDDTVAELEKHRDLPLDIVIFKNFNNFVTKKQYPFKLLDICWLQYNAFYMGLNLAPSYAMAPNFYEKIINRNIINNIDKNWINQDLDKWEKCADFLKLNSEVSQGDHPSKFAHGLWALHLIETTGWARPYHTD
jgi:hypothetical protein